MPNRHVPAAAPGLPASRRGFLRGLLTLPLIGGGVQLIGSPSAVAVPNSRAMMLAYSEWLRVERNRLHMELFANARATPEVLEVSALPMALLPDNMFYVPPRTEAHLPLPASSRAALVLSTVGADFPELAR